MYRMGKEEIDAVTRVITSKKIYRVNDAYKETLNFETEWAKYLGTEHVLLTTGGTGSLITCLAALGIGPGDEVIVPGYTFIATAHAVLAVGAIPVICNVDETLCLDPIDFERLITPNVRAVIPVHMMGRPCNMEKIMEIAKKHNIFVVEDACQADGASFKGKKLGTIGDMGAFSFNFFKIISAGESGALATNDRKLYERSLIYHDSGLKYRPYGGALEEPFFIGQPFRANEILASILRIQIIRLDGIIKDLKKVQNAIKQTVNSTSGLKISPSNDEEGDIGIASALIFDSEDKARKFAGSEGIDGWLPYDTDRHVYIHWDPIVDLKGGHCDAMNPFLMEKNKDLRFDYSNEAGAKTLDILARSVFISLDPDWNDDKVEKLLKNIQKAANSL